MDNFDNIFMDATEKLPSEYFYLPMHNLPAMYKERVYCYELYHQLRQRWPKDTPFRLNGEVDKARHTDFRTRRMIPDFLVHQPGTDKNYLAIEVKRCDSKDLDDFDNLRWFINYGYKRALWLVYGQDAFRHATEQLVALTDSDRIEVWIHEESTKPARRLR
ncbi:MAG: hypothetical protein IPO31_25605 [Candidatus Obscuribacter sp.]|nr:hypothetical protein [Candidatus Obscuribacter sp.]